MDTVNFLKSFYIENDPPKFYDILWFLDEEYYNRQDRGINIDPTGSMVCEYYPDYFKCDIRPSDEYELRTIFRVHGHSILFTGFGEVDDYMKSNFNSSFRNNLKRRSKALQSCFNINTKMYFGDINSEEYGAIMNKLYAMLKIRFQQLGERNEVFKEWTFYERTTLPLILEKKASLFIIYNNSEPIYVSLNHHFKKILHQRIPSFDIDYLKFGLGNLGVCELVKWCFENKYKMLDMAYGAFDYKLKWCNHTYNFEKHILYKKDSTKAMLKKNLILCKNSMIKYLLSTYLYKTYKKIRTSLMSQKNEHRYTIEIINPIETNLNKLERVDIGRVEYGFLKKAFYDFLYKNYEHQDKVEVYRLNSKNDKVFILEGEKEMQKLTYEA